MSKVGSIQELLVGEPLVLWSTWKHSDQPIGKADAILCSRETPGVPQPNKSFRNAFPQTYAVNKMSHATTMLRLNCLIQGEDIVFLVNAVRDDVVSDLKKLIHSERALGRLKDIDPHTLELWKVSAIDERLCEMTSLFSAQGRLRCRARGDSR